MRRGSPEHAFRATAAAVKMSSRRRSALKALFSPVPVRDPVEGMSVRHAPPDDAVAVPPRPGLKPKLDLVGP